MSSTTLSDQLTSLKDKLAQSKAQINTRFFGQERVVDQVLTTMLAGGHAVWWVSRVSGKPVWLKQWPPLWVFQMRGFSSRQI